MFIELTTVVNAFQCFLSLLMLKTAKLECRSLVSLPSLTQYLQVLLEPVQIEYRLGTHLYGKLFCLPHNFSTRPERLVRHKHSTVFNALKQFLSLLMLQTNNLEHLSMASSLVKHWQVRLEPTQELPSRASSLPSPQIFH